MTIDISVLELDTCNACPRRRLIRAGMNALHRTGDLTDGSAIDYVARVCHGCLAEGSVRAYPSGRWPVAGGRWPVWLLAYADDPDGLPMPADGGPR